MYSISLSVIRRRLYIRCHGDTSVFEALCLRNDLARRLASLDNGAELSVFLEMRTSASHAHLDRLRGEMAGMLRRFQLTQVAVAAPSLAVRQLLASLFGEVAVEQFTAQPEALRWLHWPSDDLGDPDRITSTIGTPRNLSKRPGKPDPAPPGLFL